MLSEKSETADETKWLAYARGNEALTFTWRRKTEDHHVELPLRLRGSPTQFTNLGEDSTSIHAEANFEVVQGAAREVRIQLPDKITVNQVSGAMGHVQLQEQVRRFSASGPARTTVFTAFLRMA